MSQNNATPDTVLQYWFGDGGDALQIAKHQETLWWKKSPSLDAEVCERFGALRAAAIDGELAHWEEDSRGRLALIILLDQMSRNIFRDRLEAFTYDYLAQEMCLAGLDVGADEELQPIERVFFYLPMEHSESRVDQVRSVALFTSLSQAVPPAQHSLFTGYLEFARAHQTIIERFGRFPHRNKILQRPSTEAELKFLTEPGSSF